jgi:hypothetical protein
MTRRVVRPYRLIDPNRMRERFATLCAPQIAAFSVMQRLSRGDRAIFGLVGAVGFLSLRVYIIHHYVYTGSLACVLISVVKL